MDAKLLVLILTSILELGLCFSVASDDDGLATEFPFAQAKVKYHRSRYCITAFGETNCVRMEESPGDAKKIAKLYKLWMSGYQQNPDQLLRSMLEINQHIKKNKQHQTALRQNIEHQATTRPVIKPSQRNDPFKLSQLSELSQRTKVSQKNKGGDWSQFFKQAGQSDKIEQTKLKWLSSVD